MQRPLHRARSPFAFTLVELLCVITIIAILIGLMLGPVSRAYAKARNFKWEHDHGLLMNDLRDRLAERFGGEQSYPAFSREALYESGIIDARLLDFLKDKRVKYFPFSSTDPDEMVILSVNVSKKTVSWLDKNSLKPAKE